MLPGVPDDNLEMTMQGNTLVVKRRTPPLPRTSPPRGATHFRLPYGKFERKVDLPNGLDTNKIEAQLHHGVLDIRIPVSEAVKPRKIEIQREPKSSKKIAA